MPERETKPCAGLKMPLLAYLAIERPNKRFATTPTLLQISACEKCGLNQSWTELRHCKFEESRTVQVFLSSIWEDVDRRLSQLKDAQQVVVENPEILRGTPVIRGTRVAVHDVASLVEAGTPVQEILEIYPKLTPSEIGLASIYAKANLQRGRPRRRHPRGRRAGQARIGEFDGIGCKPVVITANRRKQLLNGLKIASIKGRLFPKESGLILVGDETTARTLCREYPVDDV